MSFIFNKTNSPPANANETALQGLPIQEQINLNFLDLNSDFSSKLESTDRSFDLRFFTKENVIQELEKRIDDSKVQSKHLDNLLCQALLYFIENNITWNFLRLIELKKAKDFEKALECIETILSKKTNEIYFLLEQKHIYESLNRKDLEILENQIDDLLCEKYHLDLTDEYLNAFDYMLEFDFLKALSMFEKIALIDSKSNDCLYYQTLCLLALNTDQQICYSYYVRIWKNYYQSIQYENALKILIEFVGFLVLNKHYQIALKWLNFVIHKLVFRIIKNRNDLLILKCFCCILWREFKDAYEIIETLDKVDTDHLISFDIKLQLEQYLLEESNSKKKSRNKKEKSIDTSTENQGNHVNIFQINEKNNNKSDKKTKIQENKDFDAEEKIEENEDDIK